MGEFTIQCTLCGSSFGCERDYDTHPCMNNDVKVPFRIKLEQDEEEEELEDEAERLLQQVSRYTKEEEEEEEEVDAAVAIKEEAVCIGMEALNSIKEESPDSMDFEDEDPLGFADQISESISNDEAASGVGSNDNVTVDNENVNNEITKPVKVTDAVSVSVRNECTICGKRFFKRTDYLEHTLNSHKIPRPYQCNVCKKRFTQKHYVTLHMRVHTGERPYKCKLCNNTYTHKTSFTIHMRIHNGERPYMCGLCDKKCYDKSGLTSHMRSHTKETPYECEVCGRRFTHSKSLLVHRRNHTGEKPYECQYCGKCFRHWHKHKIHIRLHTGERPYKCNICGKGFPRNDEVKRHMRSHQGIKAFKCSICGVYCATQASITGHIDLHHADLKKIDGNAPEKTLVKNSMSGILGTKAPQPRTIYKPVSIAPKTAATQAVSSSSTSTQNTTTTRSAITEKTTTTSSADAPNAVSVCETSLLSKGDKTKSLSSYKAFIEQQEKILANKGLTVKEPLKMGNSSSTVSSSATSEIKRDNGKSAVKNVSILRQNATVPTSSGSQGVPAEQIIIPSQNNQMNGAGQIVIPHSVLGNRQVRVLNSGVSTTGPRVVLQSSMVMPQTSLIGGNQLLMLSPSVSQTAPVMLSQPVILLAGRGNGPHMVLMPTKSTANIGSAPQIATSNASESSSSDAATSSNSTTVTVKQEPEDPSETTHANNHSNAVPKVVIKQEPDQQLPMGIVIKQEPPDNTSSSSINTFCNFTIKQEPQDPPAE